MNNLDNYDQEELIIDAGKAQVGSFIYFIPFIILFGIPYYLLWNKGLTIDSFKNLFSHFGNWNAVFIILIMLAGIIIHELIHGLTWSVFAKDGLKSIKYGVIWKWLTPYCHCKEPLLVKQYITGAVMPAIILGFIPSIIGIITGNFYMFIFGLFFTFAAGGDFMIINLLRKAPLKNLVQDHPTKIGCILYKPKLATSINVGE